MRPAWIAIAVQFMAIHCAAQDPVDYERQIKPVFQSRCYACHGALKQESALRLDTAELARRGGSTGAAISAGDPAASLLVQRITSTDDSIRMPPEGEPLKPTEIDAITRWISQGAKGPADEKPERDPRDHWAFRIPVRPPVPDVTEFAGITNPIDAFITSSRQKHGITPQGPADKRVWLRRVSIDLVGLPPTLEQLEAFATSDSLEVRERIVSELLGSPQYAERWGRHWMDIWRYSDWWGLGAEVRNSQKHLWHWRDWIIESLNADKGYDKMLLEMLAADELYPTDFDKLRGSGFLARQYFKFNRTSWLDETIEHTSKAMLGLTLNCAKCHDHKYDPLSQEDYYRFRAIFEPYQVRTDVLEGELDLEKNGLPRPFDCNPDAPTYIHIRGDDRNPDKTRLIEPSIPKLLLNDSWAITPVTLPPEAVQPGLRPHVVALSLEQADNKINEATTALAVAEKMYAEAVENHRQLIAKNGPDLPADALSVLPRLVVGDTFQAEQPDLWEVRDGKWSYADGRLKQLLDGATRSAIRLKRDVPMDFEARLVYVPTGGSQWRSVGLTFDVNDDSHEVLAYLSSFAGGPKSQIAYKQGGNYVYPQDALQNRAVALNQAHEILLRVRGQLINVLIDGQASIVYRLPLARRSGHMEIITFDATAQILAFELNELGTGITLVEPPSAGTNNAGPFSVEQARLSVEIARKTIATAQAQKESVQARATADGRRFRTPAPADVSQSIAAAVRAERLAAAAKLDEDVSRAELEQSKSTGDKTAAATKKLNDAKAALEKARQMIDTPGETYTSLMGSLKTLESNLETEESRRKPFPTTSTGRRTALARWIADPRNPLTARVAVNHIWSRHFGKPLVPTVFDFGRKGTPPTHPELLDWLAVEFMDHGWSMKHIHRLIVLSNTYSMSSSNAGVAAQTRAADADNRFYWRRQSSRMDAQVVRDCLLSLAGELDLTRGGPPIPVNDDASRRRSMYFVHSHNEHQKFLSLFDDASVLECYRRAESIVPQQALALENSALASTAAEKICRRILSVSPNQTDQEFIRNAFLTILSVEPSDPEMKAVLESLTAFTQAARQNNRADPQLFSRTSLILALLNHNDFVTVR